MVRDLPSITVRQASRLLSSGAIASEQLCSYCHDIAAAGEDVWGLNAFQHLLPKSQIVAQARLSDERRSRGNVLSQLDGIPMSIKSNIAVSCLPLTAGSRILGAAIDSAQPVRCDADVSKALLNDAGSILIGTTNMDEFGMGSLGTNVAGPENRPTKNPLSFVDNPQERVMSDEDVAEAVKSSSDEIMEFHAALVKSETFSAGGSSCGSAASVSHGSSIFSLGSDTGGSVRLPSAWCGLTGFKPTYGIISRHGLVSYASSLDTIGILAQSSDCVSRIFQHLTDQQSGNDSTQRPYRDFGESHHSFGDDSQPLGGMKIGIPAAFSVDELPKSTTAEWARAAQRLDKLGASVFEISTEFISAELLRQSLAAYYVLVTAEASSNLARYDGFRFGTINEANPIGWGEEADLSVLEQQYASTRTRRFGDEVSRRVLCGTFVLSSDGFHTHYEAAVKVRAALRHQMHAAFDNCDLMLVPTTVSPPVALTARLDQTEMFLNDIMTVPTSLSGLPALSIVMDTANDKFPPSVQIVGKRNGEGTMLRAGIALQSL